MAVTASQAEEMAFCIGWCYKEIYLQEDHGLTNVLRDRVAEFPLMVLVTIIES